MLVTEMYKNKKYKHNFSVNGIILSYDDTNEIRYNKDTVYYQFSNYTIYDIANVDMILMLENL